MELKSDDKSLMVVDGLLKDVERRVAACPTGTCPVDVAAAFLRVCRAQTCGKCSPCRVGLGQMENLMDDILDKKGNISDATLDVLKTTAETIRDTADCAIGITAAQLVLNSLEGFDKDYKSHIAKGVCDNSIKEFYEPVPCRGFCPADVDIPGYIALVGAGRYEDAVKLIRKDNPFPSICALICEHPCEKRCRRSMIDAPLNIRGIKRFATDNAGRVSPPTPAAPTGKKVAIIGGGPSGLSAAYYLQLMGHSATVFEKRKQLGGMLRYGIPSYRFPREKLDAEIASILSTGVEVRTEVDIGTDITMDQLKRDYDAVYIAIGAHTDRKAGLPGEDSGRVTSAVELLRGIGDNHMPDFTGKKVVVIGGGNVAMDVNRSAVRLGAEKVTCVYRRRQADMTALPEEVEGALAEGVELLTMMAPVRIEADAQGNAVALWVKPQVSGAFDKGGRPAPLDSDRDDLRIPADLIIMAIGQGIESRHFEESGVVVKRGNIMANDDAHIGDEKVFAGGDCVTGPATAIRAIAAGKVAAANIDEYLGFRHEISADVVLPDPKINSVVQRGRINLTEREAGERRNDFDAIEHEMTCMQAQLESARCLHCDYFGFGNFRGGRETKW
jgi:NADPH-dependent glutamate synthase beta subunit-like oxidoreductase